MGRPRLVALALVLPYVLFGLAWAFSNPAAAGPDEDAHLVKALGVVRLDLGTPAPAAAAGSSPVEVRNASISRVVTIPADLSPAGYACFQFRGDASAGCQAEVAVRRAEATGDVRETTTLGAYPPFVYLPVGAVASLGHTTEQAFVLGRLAVLAISSVLLFLACHHLVRWLGARALVGVPLLLTPVVVFLMGTLNTSALEILGALDVAAVVTVASRHPESLRERGTQVVMLVGGTLLVLSRQLGVITMAALLIVLLLQGGWREVVAGVRRRSGWLLATMSVIAVAAVATTGWELAFDHPALTGPLVSGPALARWREVWLADVQSGVGWFGWLDVRMPDAVTTGWLVATAVLVVAGVVVGRRRDRVVLVAMTAALVVLATVVYSSVFFPVDAGLQGRHILPFASILPVYAGVVVAERVPRPAVATTLGVLAIVVPVVQLWGFVLNAHRYAVGLESPYDVSLAFVARAQWAPPLGWWPWLTLAALSAVGMAASGLWLVRAAPTTPAPTTPTPTVW